MKNTRIKSIATLAVVLIVLIAGIWYWNSPNTLPDISKIPVKPATMTEDVYKNITGSLTEVIELYTKDSQNNDALLDIALYNSMLNETARAEKIWIYMYEKNPAQIQPVANLAQYYMGKQNFRESEKWFLKAVINEPRMTQLYQDLSEIYKTQERYDESEELLKQGITKNPNAHELHITLAQLYIHLGEIENAIEEYQAAISITKKSGNASLTEAVQIEISNLK